MKTIDQIKALDENKYVYKTQPMKFNIGLSDGVLNVTEDINGDWISSMHYDAELEAKDAEIERLRLALQTIAFGCADGWKNNSSRQEAKQALGEQNDK